jgi:hypothetical protein
MKTPLLAAKVPKPPVDPSILVNIPFDKDHLDTVGNTTLAIFGYPNNVPTIEQVGGRGALRVTANQGITYTVIPGKPRLFNTPHWRMEFEVMLVNPTQFKHETVIAFRKASNLSDYMFFFWKRAQNSHRFQVTGSSWKVETAPMFADTTTMSVNVWRKFAIERTEADNTMRFYVNDVLMGSRVTSIDLSCDVIELIKAASPDFFNGWIRNLKITR